MFLLSIFLPYCARAETAYFDKLWKRMNELSRQSRNPEALDVAEEFLRKAKAEFGAESLEYASALNRKATFLIVLGRFDEAGSLFKQAYDIYENVLPNDHPELAAVLNNLGVQHHWMAQYDKAAEYAKRALEIREKLDPPDKSAVAESLSNLAHAYRYLERTEHVAPLLERALRLRKETLPANDPRIAQVLQNLASALEMQHNYKGSEDKLREALNIYENALPENHPLTAGAINRLAVNLFLQRRFKPAERYFRDALRRQETAPNTQPFALAATLTDFAMNQAELDRLTEANELLRKALSIRENVLRDNHPDIARTLGNLAEVNLRSGRAPEALDLVRRATAMLSKENLIDKRARLQFLRHVEIAWENYDPTHRKDGSEILSEAFTVSQRAMRADTAATVSRMTARFAARDAKLADLVKEREDLKLKQSGIDRIIAESDSLAPSKRTKAQAGARAQLADIEAKLAIIDETVKSTFPDYVKLIRPDPITIKQAQAAVQSDEVLLNILPSDFDTYIWAVTRTDAVWTRVPVRRKELESWVTELREGLNIFEFKRRPDEKLFDLDLAHKLYKTLFENVPAAVKNKPRFIIHATGPLSTIPFHLLVEAQPRLEKATADPFVTYRQADWLVRHHAVSVIPSLSNLTTPVKKAKRKGKLFIGIGNPLLEGNAPAQVALATAARRIRTCAQTNSIQVAALPPVERGVAPLSYEDGYVDIAELRALAPLPETAQELCDAARSVGADASDILLGRQATETRLKALSESRELAEYGIVQFATHAALAGELEKSGEPGLVLTPPDKATDLDDGYLAASEVAGLNLDADWVILSACNTAGPEAEGAEGFSGLTRAFFHAGARSLLVSHWYVNSRSAARLTTLTLDALQKDPKIRRSEALRRAMLAHMADDSDPWNAHPAHWAPFVIVRAGKD